MTMMMMVLMNDGGGGDSLCPSFPLLFLKCKFIEIGG